MVVTHVTALCAEARLKPNIVPKNMEHNDTTLKKYANNEYNNKARKQTQVL